MKKFNDKFISFNDFIGNKLYTFDYEYLFLDDIKNCSYVIYLFIPVINGEVNGNPFLTTFEDFTTFKKLFYSNEYIVYAIQTLYNYVVEVVDSKNI